MVRNLLVTLSISIALNSLGQEVFVKAGVLSASVTIAPSAMLNRAESNYYLNGYAEYFLARNLSLRSDNYIFVDGRNETPFIEKAFRSYFGVAYHFGKGNWDNHIGFQPGVTIMTLTPREGINYNPTNFNASLAFKVGTTYYVWKYFNFFANLTYVKSNMSGVIGGPHKTDEIIFAAGLGFQIPTRKQTPRRRN